VVILEEGPRGTDERDKYGRWIGVVLYRAGSGWYDANEELVVRGLAERKVYK